MRKEAKAAIMLECLHRMIGELQIKGEEPKAEAVTAMAKALSVEDLARMDDIMNGAGAVR